MLYGRWARYKRGSIALVYIDSDDPRDRLSSQRLLGAKGDVINIKRIAGVPADRIGIDGNGCATVRLSEPQESREDGAVVTVPADEVFVLGDNYTVSRDSRHYGCINLRERVEGTAIAIVFPFRRMRVLR